MKTLLSCLTMLFFVVNTQAQILKRVTGNENYVSKELKLSDYNKLQVNHAFSVTHKINPDFAGYVKIYAEENIIEIMGVTSERGLLSLKINAVREPVFGSVTIVTYSSSLQSIVSEGSGNINLISPIESSEIKVSQLGSGTIIAADLTCGVLKLTSSGSGSIDIKNGKAGFGNYSVTGSGTIEAENIKTTESKVSITGSGRVKCNVSTTLETLLTGSGSVYYKGKPTLKTKTLGSGQVIAM